MSTITTFNDAVYWSRETIYPEGPSDIHEQLTKDALAKIKPRPDSIVLDIGSGYGYAEKELREVYGCSVHTLWKNEDMHDELSYHASTCDGVFLRHVLEHSICPILVLNHVKNTLVSRGWLYVEVPAPGTVCKHEENPNHYSVMGFEMWSELFKRVGFTSREAGKINVATMAGPDVYFYWILEKPNGASLD